MQRPFVAQATERGECVQARAFEGVGARTVRDEDDYRHAVRERSDMRRRKAGRGQRGKSDFGPLRSLAFERLTRLHSPHGNSKEGLDEYSEAQGDRRGGAADHTTAFAHRGDAHGAPQGKGAAHRGR